MQYRVLGPLEVVGPDGPIDLGAPEQRAVLAVLLLEAGRVVPTDRILAAVWGDDPPPAATSSLQASVSELRRALSDADARSPIEHRIDGYAIRVSPATIDANAFVTAVAGVREATDAADWQEAVRRARAALGLWRGPVLGELHDEPWTRVDASAWEEHRNEVVELLITALLGCDRTGEAVAEAERLRSVQPLRDRAAWLQLVALYRAGRSVEALDAYRDHVARLDEELGLEPSPALRDLQVAVLQQDAVLSAWPNRPGAAARVVERRTAEQPGAAHDAESESGGQRHGLLVGRRRQLAEIDELFDGRGGGPRWLVLTGPAGIGATRLAEETVAALGRAGARVLRSACQEGSGTPPWWPVRQLLRALGTDADVLLAPPPSSGAAGQLAVHERLDAALSAADGPLALLVDDVQWADPSSLRWLAHLAASDSTARIDVVLTVRDDVPAPDLDPLLAAVARRAAACRLAVPPLGVDEVGALATEVNGERLGGAAAAELAARTGGNPFFVREYARLPRDERAAGIPVSVRSVLHRRLAGVDPEVLCLLRAAAVAGDALDVELPRAMTRLDRDELADLLDEAAGHDLIVPVPGGSAYRFAHGLLRDEVLAALSAPRLRRLHARAAAALSGRTGMEDLARRASHLVAALPLVPAGDTRDACRAAARAAEELGASEAAAAWWALLPRQDDEERDELLGAPVAG